MKIKILLAIEILIILALITLLYSMITSTTEPFAEATKGDILIRFRKEHLLECKTDYSIFDYLKINNLGDSNYIIEENEPCKLVINIQNIKISKDKIPSKIHQISALLFALIEDLSKIDWVIDNEKSTVTLDEFNQKYGDIKHYGLANELIDELLNKLKTDI